MNFDATQVKTQATDKDTADRLRKLQRGELAAIATYAQALEKDGSAAGSLAVLLQEHGTAADGLRTRILALGGEPEVTSGAWGDFAMAFEGTAKLLGNRAAIGALKTGEKHGIGEYEDALHDAKVDSDSKRLLSSLLAQQHEHVALLDRLLEVQ